MRYVLMVPGTYYVINFVESMLLMLVFDPSYVRSFYVRSENSEYMLLLNRAPGLPNCAAYTISYIYTECSGR